MGIVNEKFGNDGIAKADMDMSSEQPAVGEDAGDEAMAKEIAKLYDYALDHITDTSNNDPEDGDELRYGVDWGDHSDAEDLAAAFREKGLQAGLKLQKELLNKRKAEGNPDDQNRWDPLYPGSMYYDDAKKILARQKEAESTELNTNTMTTEDKKQVNESKKPVKEAIQISTDSPQEASMMMQLLKLAGVQQVDQDMINQEPEAPAHGEEGHVCGDGEDDAMGSQEMGRMRDIMTAPAEEKAEENFANSMGDEKEEPKIQDTDTLVNTMSGGMNRQKKTYPKVASGDNPMAVEDTITAESLANSLREQYDTFKETYTKVAEAKAKPDFLDMDKDGNKKEPMKKAIKDKEAK
jgi:hypothetical protein